MIFVHGLPQNAWRADACGFPLLVVAREHRKIAELASYRGSWPLGLEEPLCPRSAARRGEFAGILQIPGHQRSLCIHFREKRGGGGTPTGSPHRAEPSREHSRGSFVVEHGR